MIEMDGNANWAGIEKFFRNLEPQLEHFAKKHHLAIDKYYHNAPAWIFRFKHPQGGGASIEVNYSLNGPEIATVWFIDWFETKRRSLKRGDRVIAEGVDLDGILRMKLEEILKWEASDLVDVGGVEGQGDISRAEWEKLRTYTDLPRPVL